MKQATFAMGCFWSPQKLFEDQQGVMSTSVGYTGGEVVNPSYQQVCTGDTGHAEAVNITYDESIISYNDLLTLFFENHNPTHKNRQGVDVGSQYRSAIFYHSKHQQEAAETMIKTLTAAYADPIVTQVVPATTFYPAEDYHQHYLEKNNRPSCGF